MAGLKAAAGLVTGVLRKRDQAEANLGKDPKVENIKRKLAAAAYTPNGLDFKRLFQKYDKDNSGTIDLSEFIMAVRRDARLTKTDCTDNFLKQVFDDIDTDKGGEIDYDEEFREWVGFDEEQMKVEMAKAAELNKELTAKIQYQKSLAGILKEKHITQIKQKMKAKAYDSGGINYKKLYKFYDRNNDGLMSFIEFKSAVRRDAELSAAEVSDEGLKVLFDTIDKDGEGELSFEEEFLPWLMEGHQEKRKKRPKADGTQSMASMSSMASTTSHKKSHFHVVQADKKEAEVERLFDMVRRKVNAASYGAGNRSLREVFNRFDKDKNGLIDLMEFRDVIRICSKCPPLELPDAKIDMLFNRIDKDGEGEIDFEGEFMKWMESDRARDSIKKRVKTGRNQDTLFKQKRREQKAARKKEAAVMMKVLKQRMIACGYQPDGINLQKLFRDYDKNNDQVLDFGEFRAAVRKEAKITANDYSDKKLRALYDSLDLDSNGNIDANEFIKFLGETDVTESTSETDKVADTDDVSETPGDASSPGDGATSGGDPNFHPRAFDKQIDRLITLVRTQNEQVTLLRSEHSQQLANLRTEYDALCACLETSGILSTRSLNTEMLSQLKTRKAEEKESESPAQGRASRPWVAKSPASQNSPASAKKRSFARQLSSKNLSTGEEEPLGLYDLMYPLLFRVNKKSERERLMATVTKALEQSADPNSWKGPSTPIHSAQKAGDERLLTLLLAKRASVNAVDLKGVGVLHGAAYDGQNEIAQLLIKHKANPNITDRHDQTPLFFAPTPSVCEILFKAQADLAMVNTRSQSALHLAAIAGLNDALRWMAKRFPRLILDQKDENGKTAKQYAIRANVSSDVLHVLNVWEPRLHERHAEEEEMHGHDESAEQSRRRLWEMAHAERNQREGSQARIHRVKISILEVRGLREYQEAQVATRGTAPQLVCVFSLEGKEENSVQIALDKDTCLPARGDEVWLDHCSPDDELSLDIFDNPNQQRISRIEDEPFAGAALVSSAFQPNGFEGSLPLESEEDLNASIMLKVELLPMSSLRLSSPIANVGLSSPMGSDMPESPQIGGI